MSGDNFKQFLRRALRSLRLITQEKEIILFALLQWVVIGLGYYLWVQILGWIPESVWENEDRLYGLLLNLVFLAWSFVCVGLVAYPLGILTGCMGAAHFLRAMGHPSTIAGCLKLVLPRSSNLWIFHWIDGLITVDRILERLPKRSGRTSLSQKLLEEALYYAWKMGTIGILSALLSGQGLIEAGKTSIRLVKSRFKEVALLRGGYSLFCWVIGISAYGGSVLFFIYYPDFLQRERISEFIYWFYFWMGIPILVATGIVQLFLRPIYVLSSCQIYSDFIKAEKIYFKAPASPSRAVSSLVVFLLLALILTTVYLFRGEIGLMKILGGAAHHGVTPFP